MKYGNENVYINDKGIEVPSVTTILKLLNKPALVYWANSLGFRRTSVKQVLEESSKLGTLIHKFIYCDLMEKTFVYIPIDFTKKDLSNHLNNFYLWKNKHEIKPIFMENKMVSDLYGGTVDFFGKFDNLFTILDFKTSKAIYATMFLQLAGYLQLIEERDYSVDRVGIVGINQNQYMMKLMTREEIHKYIYVFNTLVELFHKWYDLNIEDKWGNILS